MGDGLREGEDTEEAERSRVERRIEEIDEVVRKIRAETYSPENIRRLAELSRERDDLIRRLFEIGREGA